MHSNMAVRKLRERDFGKALREGEALYEGFSAVENDVGDPYPYGIRVDSEDQRHQAGGSTGEAEGV